MDLCVRDWKCLLTQQPDYYFQKPETGLFCDLFNNHRNKADFNDYVEADRSIAVERGFFKDKADFDLKWNAYIHKREAEAKPRTKDEQQSETGLVIHQANPNAARPSILPVSMADSSASWEPIVKGNRLPAFPLEIFPGWIKDYIDNFSDNTGINKDFCAACVLGAVSTVICGHLQVHFNGTHYEPAQLYTVFVGRSGSMKSTAVKEFHNPSRVWMMEKNKAVNADNQMIAAEIDELTEDLAKERKKKAGQDENRIADLKAQIDRKRERMKVMYPVPYTDVVPESVIKAMNETNGIVTIAATEGNVINVLTGRNYTQRGSTPNLDIFLAGYDGEPYNGIRVTSGKSEIPRADISILMAVQPSLLETLCRSSDANGRGLVQRFLIFAPEDSEVIIDHMKPNTTDQQHARRWNEHIRIIAERIMNPGASPVIMELYKDADMVIRELWNFEDELIRERGSADDEGITGWLSKLHGKALRLAAIIAVLDEPKAVNITKEHAEKAVKMLKEYFLPHYLNAFEAADNLTRDERKIVGWIKNKAKDHTKFKERDMQQAIRGSDCFSGPRGRENFRAALEGLEVKNYIRSNETESSSSKGRPSKVWYINPELFNE